MQQYIAARWFLLDLQWLLLLLHQRDILCLLGTHKHARCAVLYDNSATEETKGD